MYAHHSIAQFHTEIEGQFITCEAIVEHYLSRIAEHKRLNAFIEVYADEARKRAIALDLRKKEGKPTGKLFGVVVGIKDVLCYKGHTVTAGSKILKGFHSIYNATAIERLLQEMESSVESRRATQRIIQRDDSVHWHPSRSGR